MDIQKEICNKYKTEFILSNKNYKLGLAISTIGKKPINGLRHRIENDTCGWYIWCGEEFSEDPEFFQPLHVKHIDNYLPEIQKYLALPPGYRFLIDIDYEDIWFDENL